MSIAESRDPEPMSAEPVSSESSVPVVTEPRRYGRWASAAGVLLLFFLIARPIYTNPLIDHSVIGDYLFHPVILGGVWVTITLATSAMVLGTVLGVALGLMATSSNPVLTGINRAYVTFFRAVPLLVQILIWGNLSLLFRRIALTVPFTNITLFSLDTNDVMTTFVAGALGLGLHQAAYMSENVRAGLTSVDRGQREAALSMGMQRRQVMFRVVLPQAMRVIVPPAGNEFISLLKASSLVFVIAGGDLLTKAQNIAATNLRVIEMLTVASIWYLAMVAVATAGQRLVERRFSRGYHRDRSSTSPLWMTLRKVFAW
jgi:polar amino acid transport system permease protein